MSVTSKTGDMNTIQRTKDIVSKVFGNIDLSSSSRKDAYVFARATYYFILKRDTDLILSDIAEGVGRDHATALHALRELDTNLSKKPEMQRLFNICIHSVKLEYSDPDTKSMEILQRKANSLADDIFTWQVELQVKLESQPLFRMLYEVPESLQENVYERVRAIIEMEMRKLQIRTS